MSRKIIDYIVVEFSKESYDSMPDYLINIKRNEDLEVSLHLKRIELEILKLEKSTIPFYQRIDYINELLNTVQDFSNYKVSEEAVIFYREKYNCAYPLEEMGIHDFSPEEVELYLRKDLKKQIYDLQSKANSIEYDIKRLEKEKDRLNFRKSQILEIDEKTDLATCRSYFERSVIYYLERGYEPQGGVSISKIYTSDFKYCQAMVKYED